MSMWDLVTNGANDFAKSGYTRWPNPFTGMVKDIDVLACQDTWQAKVTMYGGVIGNWFWSNFVPSPVEITRKTLTGSYKCGFYFLPEFGSPIDVIPGVEGAGEMLLEISSPAVELLFYIWAAETVFSGLDAWQSIIYAQAKCGLDHDECLLMDGEASAFAGGAHFGTPNAFTEIQDRRHMYEPFGGDVSTFAPGYLRLNAVGYVVNGGCNVSENIVSFMAGTTILNGGTCFQDLGGMGPGDKADFSLSFAGFVPAGAFRINWDCINDAVGLARTTLFVNRWTASWSPTPHQHECTKWPSRVHHNEGTTKHWWIPQ